MPKDLPHLALLVVLVCCCLGNIGCASPARDSDVEELRQRLADFCGEGDVKRGDMARIENLSFDLAKKAIPELKKAQARAPRHRRHFLENCLAHIGGPEVVAILKQAEQGHLVEYAQSMQTEAYQPIPEEVRARVTSKTGDSLDHVVSTVLNNGTPTRIESELFSPCVYSKAEDTISGRSQFSLEHPGNSQVYLRFDIYISRDGDRSLCFGHYSGHGHDAVVWVLVLRKSESGWTVVRKRVTIVA